MKDRARDRVGHGPLTALLERINAARGGTGDPARLVDAEDELASMFDPACWLAVYGTLAPGEPNHRQLAHLGGSWTCCEVRGRRSIRRYPVFTWDPSAPPVAMRLLEAPALAKVWPRLDDFEGPGYRRILVPAMRGEQLVAVANLYHAIEPVPASET